MIALLPAAGHSTRMGRPKLSLPLGASTVLECTITALRNAGVERVLVVIGPHVPELGALARNTGAVVLALAEPTADMRTTIELGLAWIERNWQPGPDDGFLLCPADHPVIESATVRCLVEGKSTGSGESPSIFIPTYRGKRGHPALIGWQHVAGIRALPSNVGLNRYLREHAAETMEIPVDSDSVLIDLDTPHDYERLRCGWRAS